MTRRVRLHLVPPLCWRWIPKGLIAGLMLVMAQSAHASGVEQVRQAWDLRVALDARWCGCGAGGYYPIRLKITNRGPARELTLTVNRDTNAGVRVDRRISLDQNETQFCSLSIPIVTQDNYLNFSIVENGAVLHDFDLSIGIYRNSLPRPSLLILDQDGVNTVPFENGANVFSANPSGRFEDNAVVSPTMLPDRWIDYSGLDIVACSLTTFKSLPIVNQNAILNWIETGGTLLVYETPAEQAEVDRVLQVNERAYARDGWHVDEGVFNADRRVRFENQKATYFASIMASTESNWTSAAGSIHHRNLALGRVWTFASNPFPGSALDWACWIDTVGKDQIVWSHRNGISPRDGQQDFYEFLVPGVGEVPIYSFLFIVTVFAIIIGPVNYWLLFRRKQQQYLLLTTPLIAVVTSGLMFGYAAASDGFGIRSRTSSLTILDRRSESAVTLQRLCLFAGLAPFDGLRFSNDSALFSLSPPDGVSRHYSVDATHEQHLNNGWLPSRVMSQYLVVTRRKERTRVEISTTTRTKELQFASGLPWKIRYLVVVDENGVEYFGDDIAAGETATLRVATAENCKLMRDLAIKARPEMPSDYQDNWQYRRDRRYYVDNSGLPFVAKSQQERLLASLYGLKRPFVEPRHYIAILADKPGLEQGVSSSSSAKDLNVLIGDY